MTILIHKIQSYFKIRKLKKEIKRLEDHRKSIHWSFQFDDLHHDEYIQMNKELEAIDLGIEHKQSLINQLNK